MLLNNTAGAAVCRQFFLFPRNYRMKAMQFFPFSPLSCLARSSVVSCVIVFTLVFHTVGLLFAFESGFSHKHTSHVVPHTSVRFDEREQGARYERVGGIFPCHTHAIRWTSAHSERRKQTFKGFLGGTSHGGGLHKRVRQKIEFARFLTLTLLALSYPDDTTCGGANLRSLGSRNRLFH